MRRLLLILFLFLGSFVYAQKAVKTGPKVVAGPMLGYMEHTECLVWVQTACATKITLQ